MCKQINLVQSNMPDKNLIKKQKETFKELTIRRFLSYDLLSFAILILITHRKE